MSCDRIRTDARRRVLATASGEDGATFVKRLGANAVVDSRAGDIIAAAHDFSPGGIDAVLALASGEYLERCIDTLRPGGRVAFPNGVKPPKTRAGLTPIAYDAVAGKRRVRAPQSSHPTNTPRRPDRCGICACRCGASPGSHEGGAHPRQDRSAHPLATAGSRSDDLRSSSPRFVASVAMEIAREWA